MYRIAIVILILFLPSTGYSQRIKLKKENFNNSKVLKQEYHVLRKNKYTRHGLYKKYFKDGTLREYGSYSYGKKDGIWKEYNSKNELKCIKEYKKGRLITEKRLGVWEESFERGKVIKTVDYDNNRKLEILINVPINYPPEDREKGIEGIVKVHIKTDDNCNLSLIEITKPLSPECDKEVIETYKEFFRLKKKYDGENCQLYDEELKVLFKLD